MLYFENGKLKFYWSDCVCHTRHPISKKMDFTEFWMRKYDIQMSKYKQLNQVEKTMNEYKKMETFFNE